MAEERLQRRLAAVLSADVVGYSRLMGIDEAGTLSRLNALRRELIDPTIAAHSGRIVKLMGDGALVEFASAVDAVNCAIEIQRKLRDHDARRSVNVLVQLFHPMMPHLAEECWALLGHDTLVAEAAWPQVERELLIEDTLTLPVQINGKKRADVTVRRGAANADIETAVLALDAVKRVLDGKTPKKVIIVPQRIVNVVA